MPPPCHATPNPESCPLCRRYAADPAFAAAIDRSQAAVKRGAVAALPAPRPAATPRREVPCRFEGDVLEPCQSCGKEGRHVRECDVFGKCTRGAAGKGVAECHSCERYEPDPTLLPKAKPARPKRAGKPNPWLNPVTVPAPPPPDIKPASDRAVVTVAVGTVGDELLSISGPLMEAYARRLGADFHVSRWPGNPAWPMSAKFAVAGYVARYERVLYADADVLFRPGCRDLFAAGDGADFAAFEELAFHRQRPQFGTERECRRLAKATGLNPPELVAYWNCGVVVMGRNVAPHLAPPDRPIPPLHNSEQNLVNARLAAAGVACRRLNGAVAEWWTDPGFLHATPDAVLHFAGVEPHAERLRLMRAWATK